MTKKNINSYLFLLASIGSIPAVLLRFYIDDIYIVNLIGSFLIGFAYGLPIGRKFQYLFIFGFCGSLTTFSGWIVQSLEFLLAGLFFEAIILIFQMLIFGLFAVLIGNQLAKRLFI